jgi:hypothetical protein
MESVTSSTWSLISTSASVEPLLTAFLMAISFLLASMAFLMAISCLLALQAFLMLISFPVTSTFHACFSFFPSWQEFSFLPLPSEVVMAMLNSGAVCTCLSSSRHSRCQLEILWTCSSYPEEVETPSYLEVVVTPPWLESSISCHPWLFGQLAELLSQALLILTKSENNLTRFKKFVPYCSRYLSCFGLYVRPAVAFSISLFCAAQL